MNTMRSATSIIGSFGRLAVLGASLALAACGTSQNWEDGSAYVTIGGTVSGLTGGTLALWNNGKDKLTVPGNGSFKFSLSIANGSSYQVLVATQPDGLTCTVANGSGKATDHVTNVAVTCQPYKFTLRPLPAIYRTGKAINYSAYRAGGPAAGEEPSDADIKQDLTLLNAAGFNLVRLFGVRAPGNPTLPNRILTIAEQNFPNMKFQLGIELKGLTSCSDTSNDETIAYSIGTLARRSNVVTVSVGNETSFFSKFMPLSCLTSYIRTVRSQVTQPVTTDDDFTFYAGLTGEFGDRVAVKPDAVLAMIDFVSIHLYPISNPTWWDWRQVGVPPGPGRAKAMMEASLAVAKDWYQQVANYQYANADGITVTIGSSLPITVGETGWKAVQTTPASGIELFAALQPNQKWYYDLLYGTGGGYASWQGASGGPVAIFWFEATDEAWKGIDDGWGLWDAQRSARYALCGTPAGPACKSDLYSGAGYYNVTFANITFDSSAATYSFAGFGGAEDTQVVTDPAGAPNKVARVNRSAGAQVWAGTTVSTQPGNTAGAIPFTATNTRMTVRVYSPAAGIPVRLKVEDAANGARSVETQVNTTVANAWETLTFNFANPVPGTPALNLAYLYDRVSIFFNFGTDGATAGAQTFYFDDVTFVTGATTLSFASKYWQIDGANWQTIEGGRAGNYIDGSVPTQYWWNGTGSNPSNFFFGYGVKTSARPWGFGAYSRAPGNGTVNLSGYTNLQIAVWGNDELMSTRPTLTILLVGPTVAGCAPTLKSTVSVAGTGVRSYTLPLAGFTLQTPCSGVTTPARALTSVAEVHVQVLGTALQYSAGGDKDGFYPNGLNYGPISFN